MTLEEFLLRQLLKGKRISPLLSAPGATLKIFRRDWLHNVDQGVGADWLGNVFEYLVTTVLRGNNRKQRMLALNGLIRGYYEVHPDVKDRLVGLRGWGVKAPKKSPKLRCSAACARALIPFCDEVCQALLNDAEDPKQTAMKIGSHHLHECYKCLSNDHPTWKDVLRRSSRDFCVQYHALQHCSTSSAWKIKPQMH